MTVVEADLTTRFPGTFPAGFPTAILTAAIAEAEVRIDRDALGDLADAAVTYLAAHIARTDFFAQTTGGGISSATAGGVSISYASGGSSDASNGSGFYAEYLRILRLASPHLSLSGMLG